MRHFHAQSIYSDPAYGPKQAPALLAELPGRSQFSRISDCTEDKCTLPSVHHIHLQQWPHMKLSPTTLATVLVTAAALLANAAAAQPLSDHKVEGRHGDWQVVCKAAPTGSKRRICGLVQNVMAEDRSNVGLVIQFQEYANKTRAIRVFAPLGVLLPQGLKVKLDGKDICYAADSQSNGCNSFPFLRCTPDACIAQIAVGTKLLDRLQSSKTAVFIVYQTEEAGIGIPISMAGFKKAYASLSKN